MQSSELLEYKIITVPTQGEVAQIDALVDNITNEPILLQGNGSLLFLAQLFLRIQDIATEVVFRSSSEADGVLIYSIVDQEKYFRPAFVYEIVDWTEHELKTIVKHIQQSSEEDLVIDVTAAWQQAGEDPKSFLKAIYHHNPSQKIVQLTGEVPAALLLLVLRWFRKSRVIFYNTTQLQ